MAEPRDTTNERWTFDDQRALQSLGVSDFYTALPGRGIIGSFIGSRDLWTGNDEELITRAKVLLTKFPDNEAVTKLYSLLVAQKMRR